MKTTWLKKKDGDLKCHKIAYNTCGKSGNVNPQQTILTNHILFIVSELTHSHCIWQNGERAPSIDYILNE